MKNIILSLLFLPVIITCHGQHIPLAPGEFGSATTGLMYADSTMKTLRHMVDSLNLRFKSCKSNPVYFSRPQGKLWTVHFVSTVSDFKNIRKDIENKLDFPAIVKKYQQYISKTDSQQTVIKVTMPSEEEDDDNVSYLTGTPLNGYDGDYQLSDKKNCRTAGKWKYTYSPKDKYDSLNELVCNYFPEELVSKPIPQEYASYIAYVDCMIDTGTVITLAKAASSSWRFQQKNTGETDRLNSYLNTKMKLKRIKKELYTYDFITDDKYKYAVAHLKNDAAFAELVNAAADACIDNNGGNDVLELLVAEFVSKQKALELKRNRRVMGMCSMDQSPRIHARNIAVLAAETNSWDVFLRAHMDIMNDRFERMSDGSYAYGGRKTYLRELEALNLNIVDLMIGLSLRAENTAQHHYNGTIWRLGWALSESRDTAFFEAKAMQMMRDDRLDDFNRGLMFLLYKSYLYALADRNTVNMKIARLKKDEPLFSGVLRSAIHQLKEKIAKDDN